jgi:energy-coupling factor transporter ATP-binding protein EcfA2
MTKKTKTKPMPQTLRPLVDHVLRFAYFATEPDHDCPIQAHLEAGAPDSRVLVITGGNASGKSFFAKVAEALTRQTYETEFMRVGMERRTAGGFASAFMFGDESWQSTGQISVNAVMGGLSTCRKREKNHVLCLDEPDIGLSEEYQAAMGETLARFAEDLPEKTRGLIVVTHSRHLLRPLLRLQPIHLRVGEPMTLEEYVNRPMTPRPVEDLETLGERAVEIFRVINDLMSGRG